MNSFAEVKVVQVSVPSVMHEEIGQEDHPKTTNSLKPLHTTVPPESIG